MATIGRLQVDIAANSAAFQREIRAVDASVNRLGRNAQTQTVLMQRGFDGASRAVATLKTGLLSLGVGIGMSAITAATRNAIAFGDTLGDLSQQVGISAERLQQLRHTATLTGASAEALDKGVQIFARGLGQAASGTGTLKAALEANNIAVRDSSGAVRDTADVLDDYVAAASQVETAAERAALSQAAFGRGGVQLTGLLGLTRDQLRAYAADASVVSDENVAALSRSQDAIDRFSQTLNTTYVNAVGTAILTSEDFINVLKRMAGQAEATRLQQLAERTFSLSAEMEAAAQAAASGDRAAQAHLETLRMEERALVDEMAALQATERATKSLHETVEPLYVDIHKQAEATDRAAASADKLTGSQKRLAEAGKVLLTTSAQEERFDHQAEAAERAAKATAEQARVAKASNDALLREQERFADRQAETLAAPLNTFVQNLQNETASTFRTILDGGVKTFDDLFDTALSLAKDFAAQMAALLVFNPQLVSGAAGAFGAAGAAPSLAGQLRGGPLSLSQPITGVPAGQPITGFNWTGTLGAAGIGGLGGALLGSQIGGTTGALAGGLGGAAGAGIGFALGGPFGALLGGTLGSVGGSLLGSLFGGGGDDKTKGAFSGGLGSLKTSGDSAISSAVKKVDDSILALLDSRQEAIARQVKLSSTSISVSGGLSSSDLESITSARLGPISKALGFKTAEILRGDAEQALKNFQAALQTRRTIEDLTGAVSPFERQLEDLENQFQKVEAQAKRFGISISGLAEAQAKATEELLKAQDQALVSLLDPFQALSGPLEAFATSLEFSLLSPLEAFQRAQADFERIAGLAQAGDLAAIGQLQGAGQLFIDLAKQVQASPGQATATAQVQAVNVEVLSKLEAAEREAGQDIEDAVDRHRREEIATLREMIDEIKEVAAEIRKGNKRI
jgi:hypothetical protein